MNIIKEIRKLVQANVRNSFTTVVDDELLIEYDDGGRIRDIIHMQNMNSKEEIYQALEQLFKVFDCSFYVSFDGYEEVERFINT